MIAYDRQDDVSAYNGEQSTPGYAIANVMLTWNAWQNTRFELQARNLFNRSYQNHLAGINRVMNAEIPAATRLYGAERTLLLGAAVSF